MTPASQQPPNRVTPLRGITKTRHIQGDHVPAGKFVGVAYHRCAMPACPEMIGYQVAVIDGSEMTIYWVCGAHRYKAPQHFWTSGASLWRKDRDEWYEIEPLHTGPPLPQRPQPTARMLDSGQPLRYHLLPDSTPRAAVPVDQRLTTAAKTLATTTLIEVFEAHWPSDGLPPTRPGGEGLNWLACPACGHQYTGQAPLCPTLAVAWPLLARRRRCEPAEHFTALAERLARRLPRPSSGAAATERDRQAALFTPHSHRASPK